ncbi:MAG TPA: bifunctional YncE family protein/alkaline phosphatase family protein [Terriglobia bacterium]
MRSPVHSFAVLVFVCITAPALAPRLSAQDSDRTELSAPAGKLPTSVLPDNSAILPNGRRITPRGVQVKVAPHPYGLTLSPDGSTLVTVNSGTSPFSVSIVTNLADEHPQVAQIPPGVKSSDADPKSVFLGAAIAPDNRTLYLSEGNNGQVGIFDMVSHQRLGALSLDDPPTDALAANPPASASRDSLTGDLKLSPDGRRLFVLDLAHFRLVIFDTASRKMISSTGVGLLPFGLALSPNGVWAYVSNIGMFTYSLVPGLDPNNIKDTGINFPPFGFPSKEAEDGTVVEGHKIPGLGDPNSPGSNSVWALDVSSPTKVAVKGRIPTGIPVGPKSIGGASPGAVVAGEKSIYVSNAAQDSIVEIDARTLHVKHTLRLEPTDNVSGLRGVLPFGLALSPDESRLYVACAGINAIAVIDARHLSVRGYIPTAWFPARVAVSAEGTTLYVASAKGFGAGPNGGPDFHAGPEGTYIGDITHGTVSILKVPDRRFLQSETTRVLLNNGFRSDRLSVRPPDFPIPTPERPASPRTPLTASTQIRHVIFVVKENRTYDQVFGDVSEVSGEKANGEPSIAEYGLDATVRPSIDEKGAQAFDLPEIDHARVSPNHHALANRFGLSDNFYVDSDVSVDGHHWLVGNYPNELVETSWAAAYGGQFDFRFDPDAPGRLEIGATSPWPESYLEAGSLWEHLARHKITFRNYGEALEMANDDEEAGLEPTGVREVVNMPIPEVLLENTSRIYPTFNTNISDQYRFQQFKKEWDERYAGGREPLPQFMFIWLPNDHTADPRPADGYPYRASYVADNDLALGRLVQLVSHSAYWKDTAIFVTEDDAQSGTDHVDAHRSALLVISPYSRRGVSHEHTSIESILKTFDLIFGIPYLNQYDAAATDLSDCFTEKPDFTPYDALPPDTRVFDPAKVVENGLEPAGEPLDDPNRMRRELQEQQAHPKAAPPGK